MIRMTSDLTCRRRCSEQSWATVQTSQQPNDPNKTTNKQTSDRRRQNRDAMRLVPQYQPGNHPTTNNQPSIKHQPTEFNFNSSTSRVTTVHDELLPLAQTTRQLNSNFLHNNSTTSQLQPHLQLQLQLLLLQLELERKQTNKQTNKTNKTNKRTNERTNEQTNERTNNSCAVALHHHRETEPSVSQSVSQSVVSWELGVGVSGEVRFVCGATFVRSFVRRMAE